MARRPNPPRRGWRASSTETESRALVPVRPRGGISRVTGPLFGLLLSLVGAVAWADTPVPLAPGYGALGFAPPVPGSYALPVVQQAADGDILLSSGEPARLHELLGDKLVLLSFIYSNCSDVNGCPLATAVLQGVKQAMAKDATLAENLRLVTLSFDPQHDTPEVMALYGRTLGRGTGDWLFATTASSAGLAPILSGYNQPIQVMLDANGTPTDAFNHLLKVYLVDRARRIRNIYSVAFLHRDVLLADVRTLLMESGQGADVELSASTRAEAGPETVARSALFGPGDDRRAYSDAAYESRALSLQRRLGRPADLVAHARSGALGLPELPVPASSPLTPSRVALGRKLFFDRRLSLNDTVSCAMCHIPEQGFTNNELATSIGFEGRTVRRNAPSLYNVGFQNRLFHDGRETSLETQVWQPLVAENEMANPSVGAVLEKISRLPDYAGLFKSAFDTPGPTMETVGEALAAYQRTLVSGGSPFDRWYYGADEAAVNEQVKRGFELFRGAAGCSACHLVGDQHAMFNDGTFHNTGIGWRNSMLPRPSTTEVQLAPGVFVSVDTALIDAVGEPAASDLGLYEITQNPADRWRYKTPGLRNVDLTAPYMHDGSLPTLEAVVAFYNRGGVPHPLLDPRVRPLNLSAADTQALVAFLRALTGDSVPRLVADAFAAPIGDLGNDDPHWSHDNRLEY